MKEKGCKEIGNLLGFFPNFNEVDYIFKMAASIGLIQVRTLIFELL